MRPHISVCICTYKRPALLRRLLVRLDQQHTEDRFSFSIVVADNDAEASARSTYEESASRSGIHTTYCHEPRQNIAMARNEALRHATGDYVAFIDDDEFPEPAWLLRMLEACERLGADGVLGPVRPHFERAPPSWIIRGRFCERPEYPTGREMSWNECRTGNLLFRRQIILQLDSPPFREEFGTGGEDVDFFVRMTQQGRTFRWCNEGVVFETVPPNRWTRTYMLSRALLRGRNTLKLPGNHAYQLVQSLIAVPAYSLAMPFALIVGQHVFMKYCIRFCDHAGRLLAAIGLNPVDARQ